MARTCAVVLPQVTEQRAAVPEDATADEVAPWMSGEVEGEEASSEQQQHAAREEGLDAETLHLLHTQRQYYDSVHVIKEKARINLPFSLNGATLGRVQTLRVCPEESVPL